MNCKPGDLAVIAWAPPSTDKLIGCIVRLTTRAPDAAPHPWRQIDLTVVWNYEGERLRANNGWLVETLNDYCLRPIRNPGDDARDESLSWLPAPVASKEVA